MNPLIRSVVLIPLGIALISGCTFTFNKDEGVGPAKEKQEAIEQEAIKREETEPEETPDNKSRGDSNEIMLAGFKPDLDYSSEVPDCRTAAQRIEDNVQIGMRLADVRRVVGRPKFVFPGSWWWTSGFSLGGLPNVRFAPGLSEDVPVTGVSIDTSSCR